MMKPYRLGDGCSITHGFAFSGMVESADESIPIVVNIGNFKYSGGFRFGSTRIQRFSGDFPEKFRLMAGDVLLVMTCQTPGGEILGIPGRIPADGKAYLHNQRMGKVVINRPDELDLGYLYYLFLSRSFNAHLVATATGSKILHTAPARIENFVWPRPPLPVQRRIADILCAYDDLIENNTKRIKILEEMAGSLYREWFDSPESKGQGSVLTAQELIDQRVLEINDGYRAKNSELGRPGLPFARAGNVNDGFHFDDADLLHESNVAKAGTKVSRAGDVVFTSKGTVGRFAWVRERTPVFVYSPQLCFWRVLRPDRIEPAYLSRWMQSSAFVEQVNRVKGSTDMADYVSLTDQKRMRVDVPDPGRQQAFATTVAPLDSLVANLQASNAILRATRDLLLPRLILGEGPTADGGARAAPPPALQGQRVREQRLSHIQAASPVRPSVPNSQRRKRPQVARP